LDLLKSLRAEKPKLAVLMLSMYSEDIYALRAIKHGAAGYLTKNVPAAILVAAVRKAAAGGKHISPELAEICVDVIGRGDMAQQPEWSLDHEGRIECKTYAAPFSTTSRRSA